MRLFQRIVLANLVVRVGIVLLLEMVGLAQNPVKPPQGPLTLDQAVDFGLTNSPAVRASMERALASKEGVSLSPYDVLAAHRSALAIQSRHAKQHLWSLFPQTVVPPISGPALSSTSDRGVWGSAAGILISWEPFDFGYRGANVDVAKAGARSRKCGTRIDPVDISRERVSPIGRSAAAGQGRRS